MAAGFTDGQAEELRRAVGFKRSAERMVDSWGVAAVGIRDLSTLVWLTIAAGEDDWRYEVLIAMSQTMRK